MSVSLLKVKIILLLSVFMNWVRNDLLLSLFLFFFSLFFPLSWIGESSNESWFYGSAFNDNDDLSFVYAVWRSNQSKPLCPFCPSLCNVSFLFSLQVLNDSLLWFHTFGTSYANLWMPCLLFNKGKIRNLQQLPYVSNRGRLTLVLSFSTHILHTV